MKSLPTLVSTLLVAMGLSLPVSAQITWTGAGGDGLWNTAANWDSNSVPTSGDNVVIGGTTTVSVNSAAQAAQISLGETAGDNVTLNVNSNLTYGDSFGTSDWGLDTSTVIVNINNGGILSGANSNSSASRIDGYAAINVNSGGLLEDIYRIRLGIDINVDGSGVFVPIGNNQAVAAFSPNDGTSVNATNGGIIRMLANGNGSTTLFQWAPTTTADLENATFEFDIIDGYIPMVGDEWDISNGALPLARGNIGDGSNISTVSADGLWEFEYDLSEWNTLSANNKGQITLLGVTAIPEPTTGAMLLGAAALLLTRRRRA